MRQLPTVNLTLTLLFYKVQNSRVLQALSSLNTEWRRRVPGNLRCTWIILQTHPLFMIKDVRCCPYPPGKRLMHLSHFINCPRLVRACKPSLCVLSDHLISRMIIGKVMRNVWTIYAFLLDFLARCITQLGRISLEKFKAGLWFLSRALLLPGWENWSLVLVGAGWSDPSVSLSIHCWALGFSTIVCFVDIFWLLLLSIT